MSEDDATEMIYEHQEEQIALDTVNKLEDREDHSVLEAEMVKGEPLYPHELTRDAVLNALRKPQHINMNIVYAQRTRQILDQMLGFTITPILWKHVSHTAKLSAGRCQTPALRIVYENYIEIKEL